MLQVRVTHLLAIISGGDLSCREERHMESVQIWPEEDLRERR